MKDDPLAQIFTDAQLAKMKAGKPASSLQDRTTIFNPCASLDDYIRDLRMAARRAENIRMQIGISDRAENDMIELISEAATLLGTNERGVMQFVGLSHDDAINRHMNDFPFLDELDALKLMTACATELTKKAGRLASHRQLDQLTSLAETPRKFEIIKHMLNLEPGPLHVPDTFESLEELVDTLDELRGDLAHLEEEAFDNADITTYQAFLDLFDEACRTLKLCPFETAEIYDGDFEDWHEAMRRGETDWLDPLDMVDILWDLRTETCRYIGLYQGKVLPDGKISKHIAQTLFDAPRANAQQTARDAPPPESGLDM